MKRKIDSENISSKKEKILYDVKYLLTNLYLKSPIHLAALNGDLKALQEEIKKNPNEVNKSSSYLPCPINLAALDGHAEVVKALIEAGADVNAVCSSHFWTDEANSHGNTALMYAAYMGHEKVVEILIKVEKNNINAVNIEERNTALILAAKEGYSRIVEILMKAGADINITNQQERTALMCAAYMGHEKVVELLIKAEGNNINALTIKAGNTALILAAHKGYSKIVELLIKAGADINIVNEQGNTALMTAALIGHAEIVKILIEANADVAVKNKGYPVLALAAYMGHAEVVRVLIDKGIDINEVTEEKSTALTIAAEKGNANVVEILIAASKVNLDNLVAVKKEWSTALIIAAEKGHANVVEILIAALEINLYKLGAVNKDKTTALMIADEKSHLEVFKALIDVKSNPNIINKEKYTALTIAVKCNYSDAVEIFMQKEVKLDALNIEGRNTALMIAAKNGHLDVVEELVQQKIDLDAADEKGYTALMIAAGKGHLKVFVALIGVGANSNIVSKKGRHTALMAAAKNGHFNIVENIIQKNLNLGEVNKEGNTALMIAAEKGRAKIVNLLISASVINLDKLVAVNKKGDTALMIAAEKGHAEVVKILIALSEINLDNPVVVKEEWNAALMIAAGKGHAEVVKILIEVSEKNLYKLAAVNKDPTTALMIATERSQLELFKQLIDVRPNSNIVNKEKYTALMIATTCNYFDTVKILIQKEAKLDALSAEERNTAPMIATEKSHEEIEAKEKLRLSLAEKGFESIEAGAQGDCFFHAVSRQLSLLTSEVSNRGLRDEHINHERLRTSAIAEMRDNSKQYKETFDGQASFENYVSKMSNPGEWAEGQIISALANVIYRNHGIIINIIHYSPTGEMSIIKQTPLEEEPKGGMPIIRVLNNANHYTSLEPLTQDNAMDVVPSDYVTNTHNNIAIEGSLTRPTSSKRARIDEAEDSSRRTLPKIETLNNEIIIDNESEQVVDNNNNAMEIDSKEELTSSQSRKNKREAGDEPGNALKHFKKDDDDSDNNNHSLEISNTSSSTSKSSSLGSSSQTTDSSKRNFVANSKTSDSQNNDNIAIENVLDNSFSNKRVREDEEDSSTQTLPETEESQGFFGGCYISVSFGRFLCRHSIIEDEAVSSSDSSLLLKPLNFIMPKITIEQGYRPLQIKQAQESNPEPSNGASSYSYGDILTGLKALDVSVDVFKLSYEPTREHLSILVRDFAHLGIILTGTGGYLPLINAVDIAAHAYNGEYSQAFTQAGITAGYMLLPTMLGTALAPIYAASVLTYTGYKLASNIYSAYSNYVAPEAQLKSNLAYATLSENLGLQGMAKEYLVNAMQIVKEDVDLGYDDNSPIQDIAAKYDLAGKICEFNADEAYCNG